VIQDASFAGEGFSQTWLPHLWRVKATPMVNAQEYNSITKQAFEPNNIWDPGNYYPAGTIVNNGDKYYTAVGNVPPGTDITNTTYWAEKTPDTIAGKTSTRTKDLELNDAILVQADVEVPLTGYDTVKFYILPTTVDGQPAQSGLTADETPPTVDGTQGGEGTTPRSDGYTIGYLTGDGIAPNGVDFGHGITFPNNAASGDFFLRTDLFPNRLFRFDGTRWVRKEDNVRMTMTNDDPTNPLTSTRKTQKGTFINNATATGVGLVTSDFYTPTVDTTSYLTTETFTTGMYASAVIGDSAFPTVTVTSGVGGKALLTFSETAPAGQQVEWKLYSNSIPQKQAISKALKPKADL
jgi:hypothetical protein